MLDLISAAISALASSVQLKDRFFPIAEKPKPSEISVVEIDAECLPADVLQAMNGRHPYWDKRGRAASKGYAPFVLETECGMRYMYKSRSGILYCR